MNDENKISVGERIYQLRRECGKSQGELADLIGVSRQAVSKWETGASNPEIENLIELSKIFGVSVDEIIIGEAICSSKDIEPTPLNKFEMEGAISPAIVAFGVLVAILCNFVLHESGIGFCVYLFFVVTSVFFQIFITKNIFNHKQSSDSISTMKYKNAIIKSVHRLSMCILYSLAITFPFALLLGYSNVWVNFGSWILYGGMLCIIVFLIDALAMQSVFINIGIKHGVNNKEDENILKKKSKISIRRIFFAISCAISAVLFSAITLLNKFKKELFLKPQQMDGYYLVTTDTYAQMDASLQATITILYVCYCIIMMGVLLLYIRKERKL